MLRQGERTSLEHKDAVAVRGIDVEKVRRRHSAEASATNDDEIEGPRVGVRCSILARQRLLDGVADIASNVVEAERGGGNDRCRHGLSLQFCGTAALRKATVSGPWSSRIILFVNWRQCLTATNSQ